MSVDEVRRGRELPGLPGTFSRAFKPPQIVHVPLTPSECRRAGLRLSVTRFAMGDATILVDQEPAGVKGELLWHLSISLRHRHPSWDEIKFARYRLLSPDLCFAILLPPPELYVNVPAQDHVFHVWEVRDPREPWSGE